MASQTMWGVLLPFVQALLGSSNHLKRLSGAHHISCFASCSESRFRTHRPVWQQHSCPDRMTDSRWRWILWAKTTKTKNKAHWMETSFCIGMYRGISKGRTNVHYRRSGAGKFWVLRRRRSWMVFFCSSGKHHTTACFQPMDCTICFFYFYF